MTTIDLRDDGPLLSWESVLLSVELAGSPRDAEALVTYDQLASVYTEIQQHVRFADSPALGAGFSWSNIKLTPVEDA